MKGKIKISDTVYLKLVYAFTDEVWGKSYYSGKVKICFGDYYYILDCSVTLHYETCIDEEFYGAKRLYQVGAIWWTFWAEDIGGEKYDTDFSFDEFLKYLL
jgi:hypothetical protein